MKYFRLLLKVSNVSWNEKVQEKTHRVVKTNSFKDQKIFQKCIIDELSRFVFTPDDGTTPTMIVNIAAHPDVAGLPVNDEDNGRDLSGDYVYYLGEKIEEKGFWRPGCLHGLGPHGICKEQAL